MSIAIGLLISAVAFLPLLVWHYRHYGELAEGRLLWTASCYIYFSALVAYTIFPLPNFTEAFCAAHVNHVSLDPLRGFHEIKSSLSDFGITRTLRSWVVLEPLLNVILFIPFGFLVRRLTECPRLRVAALGLGMSLLIETAQLTANFGLAPCPYRVTDVIDLITNTSGALIGLLFEAITPRLLSRKDYLESRRDKARKVSRARRLTGMLLDGVYLNFLMFLGAASVWLTIVLANWNTLETTRRFTASQNLWITIGATIAGILGVIVPAFLGNGASCGQRIVYLEPSTTASSPRLLHMVRALSCQGTYIVVSLWFPELSRFLIAALVIGVLIRPHGISGIVSRCRFVDSRSKNFPVGTPAIDSFL
ncbi:MAG: VanZ family protein [Propionibacteriaceae bacterium]